MLLETTGRNVWQAFLPGGILVFTKAFLFSCFNLLVKKIGAMFPSTIAGIVHSAIVLLVLNEVL